MLTTHSQGLTGQEVQPPRLGEAKGGELLVYILREVLWEMNGTRVTFVNRFYAEMKGRERRNFVGSLELHCQRRLGLRVRFAGLVRGFGWLATYATAA